MKIRKMLAALGLVWILCGCANSGSTVAQKEKIAYPSGVSADDALKISRQQLKKSSSRGKYAGDSGQVVHSRFSQPYADFWFVEFDSKDFDRGFWKYLVVLDKKTGAVRYANPYVPYDVANYDWIFQPPAGKDPQ
ncbi:MAG: hypothetical protein HQL23_06490 [Candidatus Omnitrophica bacterium]|nr:hypothetical protein [Candidatus Omnitrophota bacterium]